MRLQIQKFSISRENTEVLLLWASHVRFCWIRCFLAYTVLLIFLAETQVVSLIVGIQKKLSSIKLDDHHSKELLYPISESEN